MKRSLKFSLKFANVEKQKSLEKLFIKYREIVNLFLLELFSKNNLSENYLKSLDFQLSYRYKQCAKRQAFKRALKERDYYINKTVKELPLKETKTVVMENIKGIKRNTKKEKRLRKEFGSKFQRWTYLKLMCRIRQLAEANGVHCLLISPAYTSQTCLKCGFVHKLNRNGEIFKCRNCGYAADADWNASLNILNLGIAQQAMVAGSMKINNVDKCPLN